MTTTFDTSHPDVARVAPRDLLDQQLYPPINLYRRFVRRDHEGFNQALLEALEAHKSYWTADEDREESVEGSLALGLLAIGYLAYDAGFPIEVESPYLPQHFRAGAGGAGAARRTARGRAPRGLRRAPPHAGRTRQPLSPFLPFVPSAPDIGLHFVITRRVAGASRGLYDPFLQALRESGTSGLILSGDRTEGPLLSGVAAGPRPPGRGTLVRRGESPRLVQTAFVPVAPSHPREHQ